MEAEPGMEAEPPGGRPRVVLAVLAFTGFCYVYSALAMAPVLGQVAHEFGLPVGRVGLAAGAYGLPGLLLGIVVGPLADRYGRKRFLVSGTLGLGAGTAVTALAPDLRVLVAGRLIAGVGFALAGSSIQATVAEHFSYERRGRAVGVVVGATSAATIVGVPVSGVLADVTSWRVAIGALAVLGFVACAATATLLPSSRRSGITAGSWKLYRLVAGHRPAMTLLLAGLLGAIPWITWAAYLVVFIQETFGVSQAVASLTTLTTGIGTLAGSQLGGRLGDRIGHRRVLGIVLATSCGLILLLTLLPIGLVVTALLNVVFTGLIGARNVTHTAMLTEQLPAARATMMSVWASLTAAANLLGATIGGLLIDAAGFWLLGLFCFAMFAASVVVLRRYPADIKI